MEIISDEYILKFLKEYASKLGHPIYNFDIDKLKTTLEWLSHYDEYYAIINIGENKIGWNYGIEQYLGYEKNEIDKKGVFFLRNLIHPFIRDWHSIFMLGLFDLFSDTSIHDFNLLKTRFIINIPVRKYNGMYVFVKQMSLPIQFDENNRIVSYLSAYLVVDEYNEQPLHPRIFEKSSHNTELGNLLKKKAGTHLSLSKNIFTKAHFKLLNSFLTYYKPDADWQKDIAEDRKIALSTLRVHLKEISDRIYLLFEMFLDSHPEAIGSDNFYSCMPRLDDHIGTILFLQESGILSMLKLHYEKTTDTIPGIINF